MVAVVAGVEPNSTREGTLVHSSVECTVEHILASEVAVGNMVVVELVTASN